MRNIPRVYVLHEQTTEAAARYFVRLLAERHSGLNVQTRLVSLVEADVNDTSIATLIDEMVIDQGALFVGFRSGGFMAAKMQEQRPDLHVFAINAPAQMNGISLSRQHSQRFALHSGAHSSHRDMEAWAQVAEAYDVRWVYARHMVARLVAAYIAGAEVASEAARISATLDNSSRPRAPIPAAFLLHGKGGSPAGSVSKLEAVLAKHWPGIEYFRPLLPHNDPEVLAERSVEFLKTCDIPKNALLVGISLGGLVAARFQEEARPDLQVICINSPTWADGVRLQRRVENRVSIFSSRDEVIAGRTAEWPELAEAYDYPWLTHDTDPHLRYLIRLIDWYIEGRLASSAERVRDVPKTRQESDDEWWDRAITRPPENRHVGKRTAADFNDLGSAIAAGRTFEVVLGEFLDEFYRSKRADCFAAEPSTAIRREDRVRMAGITEFLCNRFTLPQPDWLEQREYFLDGYYDVMAEQGSGSPEWRYLRIAGTPRELLRRWVIWETRWLVRT